MKKIFAMAAAMIASLAMWAQDPIITFEKTEHNFGIIKEEGGRVTTEFEFRNDGLAPLVLSNVRASCGCTTPKWTKEPIEPGQSGKITVTYNPNGRPGRFQKTVTVTSNANEPTKKLYIKGEVTPKPAKEVNAYSEKIGELSIKARHINAGILKDGDKRMKEVEYANLTDHELTIEVLVPQSEPAIDAQATLTKLQPKETGKIQVVIDETKKKTYGPLETNILVIVDGKKISDKENSIHISADFVEDFTKMSTEERQMAPILEVKESYDFGAVAAGKTIKKTIHVKNLGAQPMRIHQAYSEEVKTTAPKNAIKSGKGTDIKVEIPTAGLKSGNYTYAVILVTNDPKQSRKKVSIDFTIL